MQGLHPRIGFSFFMPDPQMVNQVLKKFRDPSAQDASSPFLLNQGQEMAAQQQGQMQMHPLIAAIMQRLGLMNMLRNRSNDEMTAGADVTS